MSKETSKEEHLIEARKLVEVMTYTIVGDDDCDISKTMKKGYKYVGNQNVYNNLDKIRYHLRMAKIPGESMNTIVLSSKKQE